MRCKICDYRLWNLKTRQCPECGTTFSPSDYEFSPNTIKFCCPHCDQQYYGTDLKGHLKPQLFNCVQCGNPIHMDQMVLRPADNVEEDKTAAHKNPWLNRQKIGFFKAWLHTAGLAMAGPARLIQSTPSASSLSQAAWFASLTLLTYAFGAVMPFIVLILITQLVSSQGQHAISVAFGTSFGFVIFILVIVAIFLVNIFIWGLIIHGIMMIGERPAGTLKETYIALCYSSASNVLMAIPCIGLYLGWLAWIWWAISAIFMIKQRHQIGGFKATFAVLAWPVTVIITLIGLFALAVTYSPSHAGYYHSSNVSRALIAFATQNNGQGPQHAIELVSTLQTSSLPTHHNLIQPWALSSSSTQLRDIPVGTIDMDQYITAQPSVQNAAKANAIANLPAKTIAHRLGDYVFTYHGINFNTTSPDLWMFIVYPDPDVNPPPHAYQQMEIATSSGSTIRVNAGQLPIELQNQNALRAQHNLAPLPDPATITHSQPATAP